MEVLQLDIAYRPHSTIDWKVAIVKILIDKTVEVIEEHPEKYIHTVNWAVKMPSVVRLLLPVRREKAVKFSRHGIFARDNGRCQYCGLKVRKSKMQYDHVIPRAQGGTTNWLNIALSCRICNQKKGGRTPEQAGMQLISTPVKPRSLPQTQGIFMSYNKSMPDAWATYLRSAVYWNGELDQDT